jgi:uncharacterized short protein YbdD (DUF466 family)
MSIRTRMTGINGMMKAARCYMGQSLRLMVGVPEYDTYVAHMRDKHPDLPVMPYQEFFRERQEARYGGKIGRCC